MNPKLEAYRRNRYIANLILICTLSITSLLLIFEAVGRSNVIINTVSYLAEAVLVASLADFIAIFALSKPIPGLKFTGLIQNKRKELIAGFVGACETKILPQKKLLNIVDGYDIVEVMKHSLSDTALKDKSPIIGKALAGYIKSEESALSQAISANIVAYIRAIDPSTIISRVERTAREAGWLHNVVLNMLDNLDEKVHAESFEGDLEKIIRLTIEEKTSGFFGTIKRKAGEWTNTLNYRDLAVSITSALREVLHEIRISSSEDIRWIEMESFLSDLIQALSKNRSFISALNKWKADAVKEGDLIPLVSTFLDTISDWLEDGTLTSEEINRSLRFNLIDAKARDINVSEWLGQILSNGLHALRKNDKIVREEFVKLATAFVENEYKSLLDIIKDVLSKLSDQGLVEKVNEVVGGDLQWLRISGAYVGLITGAVLYGVIRFPVIGLPIFISCVTCAVYIKPFRKRLIIISARKREHRNEGNNLGQATVSG